MKNLLGIDLELISCMEVGFSNIYPVKKCLKN